MTQSVYKSAEKKAQFRSVYDQFLNAMPLIKRMIDTPFGETFLLESGYEKNPPVLLLHGSCSNSAFWFNDIMALSGSFHVFAVDIPGEAGNSSEVRLSLDTLDYANWLLSVLDALNLSRVSLAGNSLGGWMALKFATNYPDRVERLMLFASGGLAQIRADFLEKAQRARETEESLTFEEDVVGSSTIPKEILDFLNLILDSYQPISIPLPVFSSDALKRLTMPVLYVAGLDDDLLDSEAGAIAVKENIPHASMHLLPGVGHMITTPYEWMLPFLAI